MLESVGYGSLRSYFVDIDIKRQVLRKDKVEFELETKKSSLLLRICKRSMNYYLSAKSMALLESIHEAFDPHNITMPSLRSSFIC